jgi:hypothetical protein
MTAENTTAAHGGTRQKARRPKTASASMKSVAPWIALVQTG